MRPGAPFLLYSDPDGRRQLLELRDEATNVTIGRRASCDVALLWDDQVSRLHAELVHMGPDWVIHDEGLSHNGTFVNGERVRGRRRLAPGDAVTVGATVIAVCGYEHPSTAAHTRDARELNTPVDVTPAQQRVLEALCRPLADDRHATAATNRAIADELTISVETVKGTLSALYDRFGLSAVPQNEKRAALALRARSLQR